jgi:hypothetical protein
VSRPVDTIPQARDIEWLRTSFEAGLEITREQAVAFGMDERAFRTAVLVLRRSGTPIVSESAAGSVYRMARSEREAEEFIEREYLSRIRDMSETVSAMRRGAQERFGEAKQLELGRVIHLAK